MLISYTKQDKKDIPVTNHRIKRVVTKTTELTRY